jgi:uncharacterized protein
MNCPSDRLDSCFRKLGKDLPFDIFHSHLFFYILKDIRRSTEMLYILINIIRRIMMEQTNSFIETSGTIFDEFGNPLAEYQKDACTWAMFSHLSGALVIFGVPLLHILGPLAIWLWKRKEYAFVADQGKEALNFQISMGLYGLVGWMLTIILIGWLILGLLIIANIIFVIHATLKTRRGEAYRYPFNLRLIR